MPNRVQIGPTVDEALWERFRDDVEERKGQVRGVLGDELENAIRQYLSDEPDPTMQRFDDRLARIEESIGVSSADGGTETLSSPAHTHAPSRLDSPEKPAANASTDKKIAYLASQLREKKDIDADAAADIPKTMLRDIVKDEYGFRRDTAKRYVETLIDEFDLRPHPDGLDNLLVTESKEELILEQRREEARKQADDKLDNL